MYGLGIESQHPAYCRGIYLKDYFTYKVQRNKIYTCKFVRDTCIFTTEIK
jgi:hypothetical protein